MLSMSHWYYVIKQREKESNVSIIAVGPNTITNIGNNRVNRHNQPVAMHLITLRFSVCACVAFVSIDHHSFHPFYQLQYHTKESFMTQQLSLR